MQPAIRKLKILEAIVDSYIGTGEPVGSKTLCDGLDFNVSSATIRNDMSELAELGLLTQPHTSSGRVPTNLGYRIYVDKLMSVKPVSPKEQGAIKASLLLHSDAPEHLLSEAAQILSDITRYAAVVTSPPADRAYVKRVKFVQTGNHTAMAVLITSTGMVRTRLFRCDFVVNDEVLSLFDNALNDKLLGTMLVDVTPAFIQSAAISLGELSMIVPNALIAIHDAAKDASTTNIALEGQSKLLFLPEFSFESARQTVDFLNRTNDITKLLNEGDEPTRVLIGEETKIPELSEASVIISKYNVSDVCSGAIAVIGPTRMNYSKTIANTEYLADTVGTMLSGILNG